MKILIFIDHDIIVRHFLHSHVFDELAQKHEVVFVFPEEGHKRVTVDVSALELGRATMRRLTVHAGRLKVWQGLFLADMLRWRMGNQHASMRRLHRSLSGKRAAVLYSMFALPGVFQLFSLWSRMRIHNTPYEDLDALFDAERPDVVIHPSVLAGVFINDLVSATRARNIPFVVIMNSWDNPSTKRAMTGKPDWLLVWGPQTQSHAEQFIHMPRERTICFGAAQFDVYRQPPRIDRTEFCRLHQIDPTRRILLYAGSSKGSDEFAHLCRLDDAIEKGELGHTVVVYRPHPWGGGGRGGERILNHPWRHVRLEQTMLNYLQRIQLGNPGITTPDYRDTHDLLSSIDALVSPLSTIIIEGALHGKPVMCFLPDEEEADIHFKVARPLTHFEAFFVEPRFFVVRSEHTLLPTLRTMLDKVGDPVFTQALLEACDGFVSRFERSYGERLVEFLEEVVTQRV